MTVSSGFFDSENGDRRYNAIQMSSIFDGIILDGVFAAYGQAFEIKALPDRLGVTVGTGRSWFNHRWLLNNTLLPLDKEDFPVAEVQSDRIDAVVIEVDATQKVRACSIKVVKGTPSQVNPQRPKLPKANNDEGLSQYALAYIRRKAQQDPTKDRVVEADITRVIGTAETPYVTGPLQVVNIQSLYTSWEAQWQRWFADTQLAGNTAMEDWQRKTFDSFDAWFKALQSTMDENTELKIMNRLDELEKMMDVFAQEGIMLKPLQDSKGVDILSSNGVGIEARLVYQQQ